MQPAGLTDFCVWLLIMRSIMPVLISFDVVLLVELNVWRQQRGPRAPFLFRNEEVEESHRAMGPCDPERRLCGGIDAGREQTRRRRTRVCDACGVRKDWCARIKTSLVGVMDIQKRGGRARRDARAHARRDAYYPTLNCLVSVVNPCVSACGAPSRLLQFSLPTPATTVPRREGPGAFARRWDSWNSGHPRDSNGSVRTA